MPATTRYGSPASHTEGARKIEQVTTEMKYEGATKYYYSDKPCYAMLFQPPGLVCLDCSIG